MIREDPRHDPTRFQIEEDAEGRSWNSWILPATAPLPPLLVANGCRVFPLPSCPAIEQLRFEGGAVPVTRYIWDEIRTAAPYLNSGVFEWDYPPPNIRGEHLLLLERIRPSVSEAPEPCPYCGHGMDSEKPF